MEKREALKEEEEKKRKALKRRTMREQVKRLHMLKKTVQSDSLKLNVPFSREAMGEAAEAGAPRVAEEAAGAEVARVGAREAETRAVAAAKATGANRGAKGTTMGAEVAEGAPERRAAGLRHRMVRVLSTHSH